jgi:hypothetical protein
MPTPSPWDFATTWTWLDHWQTLAAGILGIVAGSFALVAAWWTASRAEKISRQERCRDTEASRRSLAVEIRRSVRLLCQTHEAFTVAKAALRLPDARDVAKLTSRAHPIVYPATADRIGRLGHPLAEWVVTFYANVKDIQFAGEITVTGTTRSVSLRDLDGLLSVLEGTCRDALPLLEQLPPDDGDADLRAEIEAMIRPPPAESPPSGPPPA